jgi:hypothetical protein
MMSGFVAPTVKAAFVSTVLLSAIICGANASAFRGSRGGFVAAVGHMSTTDLRAAVLEEVMGALGNSNRVTQQRLKAIEELLQPTFLAMPKNSFGNMDHGSARYVLHRLFVQRHAMYIKGLEPGADTWNSNGSATEVLEDRVPAFVQSLFEERLKGQGLGLHELAVLAATLEHLIHDEAVERLKVAYQAHGFSLEERLGEVFLQDVLETYMMLFIKGRNVTDMSTEQVARDRASIERGYPGWKDTKKFTHQVRSSIVSTNAAEPDFVGSELTFAGASKVVEEIGERYGRWQDAECRDLKTALVKLEDSGRGRVLLKDFYGQALSGGAWQFTESVDYLRELGALDESLPQQPSVIIPNYVNSLSNCLASSSMYSVCCINECEGLMGQLEREVAASQASVERISAVISSLPSSTVAAPRGLSSELLGRLEEIASHHGGTVPLHGRLFAQWLHHAYPRECPYPHTAGSTNPLTADEWMQEKGVKSTTASKEEMHSIVQPALEIKPVEKTEDVKAKLPEVEKEGSTEKITPSTTTSASLPWVLEEQLLAKPAAKVQPTSSSLSLRSVVFILAAISAIAGLKTHINVIHSTLLGPSKKDAVLLPFTQKQHAC